MLCRPCLSEEFDMNFQLWCVRYDICELAVKRYRYNRDLEGNFPNLFLAVDRSSSCASSISCSPWWWPSSEMLLQHPIKPCHDKDVTPVENWAKDDKYRHIQLVKYRTWKDSECIQYTACFWNNDWCSQTASCKCWQFRNWPWFCSVRCRVCCLYLVSYLVS